MLRVVAEANVPHIEHIAQVHFSGPTRGKTNFGRRVRKQKRMGFSRIMMPVCPIDQLLRKAL